ncbi:hypothetical protein [Embleya sp. AB8]|uniref:hypothetical protein n=1 Tax=Embleya sp. AB8 TaxID=3156304 RepID=UPI003C77F404
MRIRTPLIAVAGAALFAFVGAGTAQAHEHEHGREHGRGHHHGVVAAHRSVSGVVIKDDCGREKLVAFHVSESFAAIR